MATTMKTIKFGENGEVYAVNAWAVERSGELTEAATQTCWPSPLPSTSSAVTVSAATSSPA